MATSRSTAVWLNGGLIGEVSATSRTGIRFRYDASALDGRALNAPLLSCSLPTTYGRADGRPFFAGLLPEGEARRAMASRAGVLDTDVFGLLSVYGQDVAGAVVIGDQVSTRPYAGAEPYSPESLAVEVEELGRRARPLGLHDDSELSLAGIQDKLLLVRLLDGSWARPVHGYPSTHILKLDDRLHRGLVVAEHTCLQLATAAGLPAAASQLMRFGELDALIVERFDRKGGTGAVPERIHQEDACQALGVDLEPSQGRAKYESHGGPALHQIAQLLDACGAAEERYVLMDQVIFTVLTGNADAHGKNTAVLHDQPGQIRLAPLYDTVPTALWPNLRTRAAMSVGGAIDLVQIDAADIVREGARWGLRAGLVRDRIAHTVDRVRDACGRIERHDDPLADRTVSLVSAACDRIGATV